MKRIIFIGFFLAFTTFLFSQSIEEIVNCFILRNEVDYEYIRAGGSVYPKFLLLQKSATTDQLIELTHHNNDVVRCYAGWALIDNKYPNLPRVFSSFLDKDGVVDTRNIDQVYPDQISSLFYHRYWNLVDDKVKSSDSLLFILDSIALYNSNSCWLIISRALDNRIYPKPFRNQIEYLAFKKHNLDALFYLSNWYKAEYYEKLKPGLTEYLLKTEFKKVGVTQYYQVVNELFKYNDSKIDSIIVNKLRSDKHWQFEKQRFIDLLNEHYIYDIDNQ